MSRLSAPTEMPSAKSSAKGTEKAKPDHDGIAKRAYQIWERKGKPHGLCEQNWREAEAELRRD